jgi:hypothetical protein
MTRTCFTAWYPEAGDLQLLGVVDESRADVRKRVAPWLSRLSHSGEGRLLAVKEGQCWRIAQALVMTAKDSQVRYAWVNVNDVWTRLRKCPMKNCASSARQRDT